MALVNKDGRLIANVGSPVISFKTEEEFNLWAAKLPNLNEDIKRFIIIKEYEEVPHPEEIAIGIFGSSFGIYQEGPDYFCLSSDTDRAITVTPRFDNGTMEYSVDGGRWRDILPGVETNSGLSIRFRGKMRTNSLWRSGATNFWILNGSKISASGDITTLLSPKGGVTVLARYCYSQMFSDCTSLTTSPQLPATTLAEDCYSNMFRSCISLITPPKLPATTLATNCYHTMFQGCTSLTTPSQLPATKLVSGCYVNMFKGCTSLTSVALRPKYELNQNVEGYMYRDVQNLFSTSADSVYSIPHKNVYAMPMIGFYGTDTKIYEGETVYGKAPL